MLVFLSSATAMTAPDGSTRADGRGQVHPPLPSGEADTELQHGVKGF